MGELLAFDRSPGAEPDGPWVNAGRLAMEFGVSTRTIRRWRLVYGMPSRKVRGSRRYPLLACKRWADQEARPLTV